MSGAPPADAAAPQAAVESLQAVAEAGAPTGAGVYTPTLAGAAPADAGEPADVDVKLPAPAGAEPALAGALPDGAGLYIPAPAGAPPADAGAPVAVAEDEAPWAGAMPANETAARVASMADRTLFMMIISGIFFSL